MICLRWFSFFMIVFIYFFLAVLCLCCFVRAFSSYSKQGLLFIVVQQLLIVVDFLCGVGFRRGASVVTVRELSFSLACGIFPDTGIELKPPVLAGGLLSTVPPGKFDDKILERNFPNCSFLNFPLYLYFLHEEARKT